MTERGFILPSPSLIMVGVFVVLSLSNVLFFNLYRSTADDYADYRAKIRVEQQALADEAERVRVESAQISRDTAAGWAAAVDYWRKRPAVTVRVPSAACTGGLSTTASPGLKPDAASAEPSPSTEIDVAECASVAQGAVLDAAHVLWLQDFILRQHEAAK